jgi:sulfite reductase alpha subunit-like flavoprotein
MARPSLLILFGSQTGCAADVANTLARDARRRHFDPRLLAMDDYDKVPQHSAGSTPVGRLSQFHTNLLTLSASQLSLPSESLVVFVVSTSGQGESPDNMKHTWRFLLRKDLGPAPLVDVRFAVFGLGDSSYETS